MLIQIPVATLFRHSPDWLYLDDCVFHSLFNKMALYVVFIYCLILWFCWRVCSFFNSMTCCCRATNASPFLTVSAAPHPTTSGGAEVQQGSRCSSSPPASIPATEPQLAWGTEGGAATLDGTPRSPASPAIAHSAGKGRPREGVRELIFQVTT